MVSSSKKTHTKPLFFAAHLSVDADSGSECSRKAANASNLREMLHHDEAPAEFETTRLDTTSLYLHMPVIVTL
jgi:hypothetical protein